MIETNTPPWQQEHPDYDGWVAGADDLWTVEVGGVRASMHATLGRACIAAAEAIGRWPGGGA